MLTPRPSSCCSAILCCKSYLPWCYVAIVIVRTLLWYYHCIVFFLRWHYHYNLFAVMYFCTYTSYSHLYLCLCIKSSLFVPDNCRIKPLQVPAWLEGGFVCHWVHSTGRLPTKSSLSVSLQCFAQLRTQQDLQSWYNSRCGSVIVHHVADKLNLIQTDNSRCAGQLMLHKPVEKTTARTPHGTESKPFFSKTRRCKRSTVRVQ